MYRGRFAPSPTGPLHLGSLTAAFGSWLMARRSNGNWLLRIEDLDPPREVPGMAAAHIQGLAAFGLLPDEPVVWQSRRSGVYEAALQRLLHEGSAFACRCTRADLAKSNGVHRRCVAKPSGRTCAFRLRVPDILVRFDDALRGGIEQGVGACVGDFVLRRGDGLWAYQLAVVVDDAQQGVTEVVRGADLLDSTPRQIFLQRQLGYETPAYAHLPVVRQRDGSKLSKSLASIAVDANAPSVALRMAWRVLGQDARKLGTDDDVASVTARAVAAFLPARVPGEDYLLPVD